MSAVEIGAAVRDARESADVSQKHLADRMRKLGFKWSQATVWSVEAGDRPLRWEEGVALRKEIGFDSSTDESNAALVRDALAYRRILALIETNESKAVAS